MKKASLALVAIALALTACGGSKKAESAAETKTASVETAAEGTKASNEAADKTEAAQNAVGCGDCCSGSRGLKNHCERTGYERKPGPFS